MPLEEEGRRDILGENIPMSTLNPSFHHIFWNTFIPSMVPWEKDGEVSPFQKCFSYVFEWKGTQRGVFLDVPSEPSESPSGPSSMELLREVCQWGKCLLISKGEPGRRLLFIFPYWHSGGTLMRPLRAEIKNNESFEALTLTFSCLSLLDDRGIELLSTYYQLRGTLVIE